MVHHRQRTAAPPSATTTTDHIKCVIVLPPCPASLWPGRQRASERATRTNPSLKLLPRYQPNNFQSGFQVPPWPPSSQSERFPSFENRTDCESFADTCMPRRHCTEHPRQPVILPSPGKKHHRPVRRRLGAGYRFLVEFAYDAGR